MARAGSFNAVFIQPTTATILEETIRKRRDYCAKNGGELDVVFIGYGALNVVRDREIGMVISQGWRVREGMPARRWRERLGTSLRYS